MIQVLALAALVFALDRGAKALAFRRVAPGAERGRATSIAGIVAIRPVRNARPYGWPAGSRAAWLAAFAVAVAAALVCVATGVIGSPAARVGLGAALGGALGNLFDRLRYGAVLDFLGLGERGSFNPADVALLVGLGVVLVAQLGAIAAALASGGRAWP